MHSIPHSTVKVKRRKDAPAFVRGAVTRGRDKTLYEKSAPLPKQTAYRFAAAMRSRPDILTAQVRRNHCLTGTPARWYVRWLRSTSPLTLNMSLRTMQDIRAQRAALQAPEMEFLPIPEREGWYWCIHQYPDQPDVCGVYEVHPTLGCSCPDYQYRVSKQVCAVFDKHMLALAASLPGASPAPRQETRDEKAERQARLRAQMAGDFGL